MKFDLKKYLARVKLAEVPPTIEGLRQLQDAQQRTIPFDNIEPFGGIVPALEPELVFRKLVTERRGGYCVELNGVFGEALQALGFNAQPILARVRLGAPTGGPRAHLAWIVDIDGEEWLADTGFGGPGPRFPVKLAVGANHREGTENFRILQDKATSELVLERLEPQGWFALYSFDRYPVVPGDIDAANFLSAVWAGRSPFPNNLMLNIRTADGRASLFNRVATEVDAEGKAAQRTLASPTDLQSVLKDVFALDIDCAQSAAMWARLDAGAAEQAA
jgi:N-hydroxyarylamine O-acetyltransferase